MGIPLADAPRRIQEQHSVFVSYRRLYQAVLDGRVPAERGGNGRWQIAEEDLPAIAETLRDRVLRVPNN